MTHQIVVRKMHRPPCPDLTEHTARLLDETPRAEIPWDLVAFVRNAEAGFESETLDWDLRVVREREARARAWHDFEENFRDEPPGCATEAFGL